MIKINENDTIVDIINKINASQEKEIILDFPFWHPVLHNYLSLKILKSKAWNKHITISTTDIASRKIWKNIWINYSIINDPALIEEKRMQNLMMHNFSFFEYMIFEIKKYLRIIYKFLYKKTGLDILIYKSPYDKARRSWVWLLLFSLLLSFWMLVFIFYFAVSKTYVYITPEIEIRSKAKNIIFQEAKASEIIENENIVPIKKLTWTYNVEENFWATWIDYENTKRSEWKVTFINDLSEIQTLKPHTRLTSSAWIMFETTDWVAIPARWKVEANVIAKLYDTEWKFIWSRWNIEKDKFILPWLKFNKDKIYAISETKFTWWSDNIAYLITKEDIENAKKVIEEKVKKYSVNQIKEKIKNENKNNKQNYDVLWVNDIIKYNNLVIENIWEFKEWDKISKFQMKRKINIETFIYNKDTVLSILKDLIKNSLLDWTEKFIFLNEKSLRISDVISRNDDNSYIKTTSEIEYWISYDFENNSNYYVKKIKNTIMWLANSEATNILTNDTKIANVSIKNSPFFLSKVTNRPENIILKIKTDE